MIRKIKTPRDALKTALLLAITAPSEKIANELVEIAEGWATTLGEEITEEVKREIEAECQS